MTTGDLFGTIEPMPCRCGFNKPPSIGIRETVFTDCEFIQINCENPKCWAEIVLESPTFNHSDLVRAWNSAQRRD